MLNTQYKSFNFITANAPNYQQFPKIVKIAKKLKVDKIWSDRFIPEGNGKNFDKSYY